MPIGSSHNARRQVIWMLKNSRMYSLQSSVYGVMAAHSWENFILNFICIKLFIIFYHRPDTHDELNAIIIIINTPTKAQCTSEN